ncbi:PEP-CTERM protein-sorting domain [Methylophilaceae bacterium]
MKFKTLTLAALIALSVNAEAAQIQSASATFTGTLTDFNTFDGYVLPQNNVTSLDLGNGISMTSSEFSTVGQNAFGLDQNGLWTTEGNSNRDGNFVSTDFTGIGRITFNFNAAMQNVGIFANQSQIFGVNNSLQLFAFDINGNVLESFTSSIDTDVDGYDEGKFVGFARSTADIYGFALENVSSNNGSFVADNLLVSSVPEPESYAMLLVGLGAIGAVARRRRAK